MGGGILQRFDLRASPSRQLSQVPRRLAEIPPGSAGRGDRREPACPRTTGCRRARPRKRSSATPRKNTRPAKPPSRPRPGRPASRARRSPRAPGSRCCRAAPGPASDLPTKRGEQLLVRRRPRDLLDDEAKAGFSRSKSETRSLTTSPSRPRPQKTSVSLGAAPARPPQAPPAASASPTPISWRSASSHPPVKPARRSPCDDVRILAQCLPHELRPVILDHGDDRPLVDAELIAGRTSRRPPRFVRAGRAIRRIRQRRVEGVHEAVAVARSLSPAPLHLLERRDGRSPGRKGSSPRRPSARACRRR